jgi:1-acyl-sn-glycerol-3-phosphate acyltransferase
VSTNLTRDWIDEHREPGIGSALRAGLVLATFMAFTLPLMPVQALLLRTWPKGARRFPHWYHRQVVRLLGIRLTVEGNVEQGMPVLLVANHTSWLDIPVLSAVAPVSFVAKKEVDSWPFVAWLARLQRSVYVDRNRRAGVGDTATEMATRLASGDALVLFAEGTSSDGNRVLPFKTSLLAAAKPTAARQPGRAAIEADRRSTIAGGQTPGSDVPAGSVPVPAAGPENAAVVQTLAIVYTHLHGVPLGRADRPHVGWYGDMEMGSHAWDLLRAGPLDVRISIGSPVPLDSFPDRKALAKHSEAEIRTKVVQVLRDSRRVQN